MIFRKKESNQRKKEGVKISLPPYKINIKKYKKDNKIHYQYSSILHPLLCSYFEITPHTNNYEDPLKPYNNLLMFYTLQEENIILSGNSYYKAIMDYHNHKNYEWINKTPYTPKPELKEHIEKNPLNKQLYETLQYKKQYNTTAYKLTKSNSYRVTLPKNLFKNIIDHTKDNYIKYMIDTSKEDLQNNKGLVTYEIIN